MNVFDNGLGFTISDKDIVGGVHYSININPQDTLRMGTPALKIVEINVLDVDELLFYYKQNFLFSDGSTTWETLDGDTLEILGEKLNPLGEVFTWYKNDAEEAVLTLKTMERVNDNVYKLTFYDNMHKFDHIADEWYNSVIYPISADDFVASMCDYLSVEYESLELNSTPYILKNSDLFEITFRDILFWILEMHGKFAYMSPQGRLRTSYPVTPGQIIRTNRIKSAEIALYSTPLIQDFVVRGKNYKTNKVYNYQSETYLVQNNPFVDSGTGEESPGWFIPWLHAVASWSEHAIDYVTYTPATIEYFELENNRVELGELLTVEMEKGSMLFYVMEKTQNGSDYVATITCRGYPSLLDAPLPTPRAGYTTPKPTI